ncbi:hypothetical protein VPHD148_0305 [Vibrio phage D148]
MIGFGWIGDAVSAVGNYLNEGQKIKAAQKERSDDIKKASLDAKLEAIRAGQTADINQDTGARSNAGWMDDISFYLFLLPVPLSFFPGMVPHIEAGFKVLENMPEYYQISLGLMLVSVWGYRRLVIPLVEVFIKQWVGRIK